VSLGLRTAEVEYLQITGSVQHIVNLLTTDNRQKKNSKTGRRTMFSGLVVAGRIRRGCGPDAAAPVGQQCHKIIQHTAVQFSLSSLLASRQLS